MEPLAVDTRRNFVWNFVFSEERGPRRPVLLGWRRRGGVEGGGGGGVCGVAARVALERNDTGSLSFSYFVTEKPNKLQITEKV